MEKNLTVCKVCLKPHMKIYAGKWKLTKSWRDEHGLLWNGKVCGQCNREQTREKMTRHRERKRNAATESK